MVKKFFLEMKLSRKDKGFSMIMYSFKTIFNSILMGIHARWPKHSNRDQTNNYLLEFLENSRSLISDTTRYYSSESEGVFEWFMWKSVHRNENGNFTRVTHNVKFDLCDWIAHGNVPGISDFRVVSF